MIAANVCAAKTLLAKQTPTLFRVHDQPETTRVENLKTVLKSAFGASLGESLTLIKSEKVT